MENSTEIILYRIIQEFLNNIFKHASANEVLVQLIREDNRISITVEDSGKVLRNFDKVIPGLVHAGIHGNVLWVNKRQFFGSFFLKIKNYHIADYNLFYKNIRDNVGTGTKSF